MQDELLGSDLTRFMLMNGKQRVWCATSDDGDEEAMMDHEGNDFTAYIVSYYGGHFYCEAGMAWGYAVPIKIVAYVPETIES